MSGARTCGDCNLCCKLTPIWEISREHPEWTLDKRRNKWCPHAEPGKGCAIYHEERRPVGCRLWRCEWMRGFGTEADRPDRIGYVISIERNRGLGWTATVYLQRPREKYSADRRNRLQRMLRAIMTRHPSVAAVVYAPSDLRDPRMAELRDGRTVHLTYATEPIDQPEKPEIREEALAQLAELGLEEMLGDSDLNIDRLMKRVAQTHSIEEIKEFVDLHTRVGEASD